jgi:predicted  nucleic acid-binding Zn-ribbon protein
MTAQISTWRASYDALEQSKKVEVAARESVLVQNEALKAEVASLREQVASAKTQIKFFENTIAAGGDNSKALTDEVKRLESERQQCKHALENSNKGLVEARSETEASRVEVVAMKSRVEGLESRLVDATKAGSEALVVNAELKRELSTLQASYDALQLSSGSLAAEHEGEVALSRNSSPQGEDVDVVPPIPGGGVAFVPIVTYIPNDANAIFIYIMENVYINEEIETRFKSQLTQEGRTGTKLTKKTLIALIESLRTRPLVPFGGVVNYQTQLQHYDFWGPNETVSYEAIARGHLNL